MSTEPETRPQTMFRVHMQADQVDVPALTASEARDRAKALRPGAIITKVKVVKEGQGA